MPGLVEAALEGRDPRLADVDRLAVEEDAPRAEHGLQIGVKGVDPAGVTGRVADEGAGCGYACELGSPGPIDRIVRTCARVTTGSIIRAP